MHRTTLATTAAATLLAATLSGCQDSASEAADGDTIVVGTTDRFVVTKREPAAFDPALSYDAGAWNMMRNTFQTLVSPPRSGTELKPDAARSCGFTDRRSARYRCLLRSGLTFSNGHRLTSRDVRFSVERVRAIDHPAGPASLLGNIDRVETPNDREVVFHLKKPDATFGQKLATPVAAIVDEQTYPARDFHRGYRMTGSGPYVLDSFDQREGLAVFTRNPRYKGRLKVRNERVEVRMFDTAERMEKALRAGRIDLMNRSLTPRQIKRLNRGDNDDVKMTETTGQEIRYLVFDTEGEKTGKAAVRRAIAQVVDRHRLVRDVYSRTVEPLYSIVPSGVLGHRNSFFNEYGENPTVADARKTLRRAGITEPVKLTLHYTTDHYGSATEGEFASLREQLDSSGLFKVTLRGAAWKEFRPAAAEGEYEVYGFGWYPDFPDADNYIAPFFDKGNVLSSAYHSKEIRDRLIPRTRGQAERVNAEEDFGRAQDIVAKDVPLLPLWQGKQYVAARNGLLGVEWAMNSSSTLQVWELAKNE
ncbi:ABC transporter substrate-binding protein [Streptomyces sp. NPDC005438]|uniref:ABC transporter substrate-binding protein n=1 Tax=Streptomyces sp. NPDC005438 TaxID=3156880 RepID=UPI0033BDE246